MTPGGRRALVALVLVAGLLIGGRSLAGFLADRWWLEAAAPEALPFFVRRSVLRGLLDLGATAFATLWWMGNLLALLRASHAPGSGIGGNPAIRRAFNHRDARLWAFVVALALGALMGVGASTWADPLLLARQGVRFGMPEPSLALDIGILVGSLPAWLRVHAFLTLLVLTTLGVTLAGQLLAGTLRIGRGRLIITDAARWHLGLLLAMLAAVIAVHQILTPYELAAGIPRPVEPGVVLLHRSVAFVLVGVSLAVIGLSVLWGLRPIHSLAAGSWLAFTLALLAAYYFLPSGAAWPSTPEERVTRERLERLGYGLEPREDSSAGRALRPSLWDPDLVAALVTGDTLPPATAVRRPAVSAGEGGGGGGGAAGLGRPPH